MKTYAHRTSVATAQALALGKMHSHQVATAARRALALVVVLATAFGTAIVASAAPIFWQDSSTGDLLSANWYNEATDSFDNVPASGDNMNLGAGGTATFSGTFSPNLFRVGHPFNPMGHPLSGPGTYTQSDPASSLTVSAFLHVGDGNTGEFNLLDGTVTNNNDFFQIGWNAQGTLNQSGGSITTNWMSLGTEPAGDGTVNLTAGSIDVAVGLRIGGFGTGVFDMSSGTGAVTAGFIAVSDLPISTGHLLVGDASSIVLDNNDRLILGWGRNTDTGAQADGTLTMTGGNVTLQTSGTGPVADMVVGWGGIGTVNMSAGTIDVGNSVITAIDGASGAAARSQATFNHSGGTINAVRMILSERGETEYNLSGTGEVNLAENLSLGVHNPASGVPSVATVHQTGGTMNVGTSVLIGEGNLGGSGVYEISGGQLHVTNDLVVGLFNGDGRLDVIGADGQVTIENNYFQDPNGHLFVQPDAAGLLSLIDVAGDALFHDGTTLEANFDEYPGFSDGDFWDVLTAANITDDGINLVAPLGVEHRIVSGGNGEILQLFVGDVAVLPGDFNEDGIVDAADYTVWRDGLGTDFTQDDYLDWRANFGSTLPGTGAGTLAAVPEPSSLALLTLAMAAIVLRASRPMAARSPASPT